jgi:ABC-2 type transport system permease protein
MENKKDLTNRQKAVSIYKWTLRKYLPFSVAYWILLFMSFPMIELILMLTYNQSDNYDEMTNMQYYVEDMTEIAKHLSGTFFVAVAIIFSTILAIMAFSYMHNKRSVDFFGSFPVSRRTLFFSRFLAVITASVVPMIMWGMIGAFLTLSDAGMINTFKNVGFLALGIVGNVSIISFISLCCGTVADVLICYGIINIVYPVCVVICYYFPNSVIPGMSTGYIPSTVFTMLCPIAATFVGMFGTGTVLHIVWWIALSAVLIAMNYILCKRRKAETAQNAFAFTIVEVVIKFIACFAAGFGLGWVFASFGTNYDAIEAQYIWFLIGAVVGIMVANILLHLIFHRGLSKYKKSLLECGTVLVTTIAFLLIITTGAFGFDMRIPDAENIESVSVRIGYNETFIVDGKDILEQYDNDESVINAATDVHSQITKLIKESKTKGFYSIVKNTYGSGIIGSGIMSGYNPANIRIAYKMKNGKTIRRTFYMSSDKLNIPKELEEKSVDESYIVNLIPTSYLTEVTLSKSNYVDGAEMSVADVDLYKNEEGWDIQKINKIVEALKSDIEEYGRVDYIEGTQTAYCIELNYDAPSSDMVVTSTLNIPKNYVNTIKALEETGYANVGYYQLKDDGCPQYDSTKNKVTKEYRTIYFEVPDNWDDTQEIQCMPYSIEDEDDYEDDYYEEIALTDIDDAITKCEKVSDNIWKYTIKLPEDTDLDTFNNVMFYQITKTDTRTTGIIKLQKNKNLLVIKNYPDIDSEDFHISASEGYVDSKWKEYKQ